MKGYVFALDDTADVQRILARGAFGVRQPNESGPFGDKAWDPASWNQPQFATFADWLTVSPGDLVFFFQNRRLYGPAQVIGLPGSTRAALVNYPESERAHREMPVAGDALFGPDDDDSGWFRARVCILFKGAPTIFREGLDMDEALATYIDEPWPMHYWAGRTFIELGADEARQLRTLFVRRFGGRGLDVAPERSQAQLLALAEAKHAQPFSVRKLIELDPDLYVSDQQLKVEASLHAALIEYLQENAPGSVLHAPDRSDTFHELTASPPKNPDWIDRLDIVTTRVSPGTDIVTNFDVIEVKRDTVPLGPKNTFEKHLSQPLRYLDFVGRHYAGGNLHAVGVYLVAFGFAPKIKLELEQTDLLPIAYSLSPRDPKPIRRWQRVRLCTYRWVHELELSVFAERWSDDL